MIHNPVLTIFYQFNPWQSSIGGIQSVICSFIKYAPANFNIRLVGTGNSSSSIGTWKEAEYAGKSVQFMPLIAADDDDVRSLIPTSVRYTKALIGKDFSSDFLHFHRIEPTLTTRKWRGKKTLFIHNDIKQQINAAQNKNAILWKYIPWAYFALENITIKQFDNILVCNNDAVDFYQQKYEEIASRIKYLKNAVDDEMFSPPTLEEKHQNRLDFARQKNLPEDTKFVLFAGRLHPQKDPVLLIRSFAALNDPQFHLLIAGVGDLTSEVKQEIDSLGMSQQVTMLGAVERQKLSELYCISSAFILTSLYEGLPIAVLEALACGTPIVTTKAGETPNFLTPNSGIVTKDRTPQSIAAGLQEVLQNPHKYPINSCTEVAKPYAARTIVKNIYEQMWQDWESKNVPTFISAS